MELKDRRGRGDRGTEGIEERKKKGGLKTKKKKTAVGNFKRVMRGLDGVRVVCSETRCGVARWSSLALARVCGCGADAGRRSYFTGWDGSRKKPGLLNGCVTNRPGWLFNFHQYITLLMTTVLSFSLSFVSCRNRTGKTQRSGGYGNWD